MQKNEILRIYGTDYKDMTKRLLEEAALYQHIKPGSKIGIKPNLVAPVPADFGATTHPEVVAGIIEHLNEHGFTDIRIIEGSWVGDKTEDSFEYCGYNALRDKYSITLIDTQKEKSYTVPCGDISVSICNCVRDVDFMINVPVLKGHCQTNITCALKNMKGLIPNPEKRRFHSMGLHKPIAILNSAIKQDFIVVDHICGDLDSEGGGNPYHSDCIMAGLDPVLIDSYLCKVMGYTLDDVPYIKLAAEAGVGCSDLSTLSIRTIGGDGTEKDEVLPRTHSLFKLKDKAEDVDTCSACYESLMEALSRLEEEGILDKLTEKICIGQGYRGKTGELGIGNCTRLFNHYVPGCPPEPDAIYEGIKSYVENKKN